MSAKSILIIHNGSILYFNNPMVLKIITDMEFFLRIP